MGKSGTTLTVKGTRGDDPNLTLPDGALLTKVVVDGLAGSDTLNLSGYDSGVTVLLEGGFAKASSTVSEKDFTGLWNNFTLAGSTSAKGTVKGIENLVGTDFNDFLFVNIHSTAKFIDGGAGNDVVNSLGGNATLVGGTGSDWLVGYWPNVTLIGGTWNGTLATPDGETDYFYTGSQCPVILDFEVGIDQLICEFSTGTLADWLAGTWVATGGGSTLMVGGVAEVTLASVGPLLAETIEIGYAVSPINGTIEGASGNDLLFVGGISPSRIILGADNGDDAAIGFDILSDVLVFEDGIVPTWSDTMVNGAPALLGTWADGSITLQGLGTDDVDNLLTEGLASAPAFASASPGPWSNAGDADFGATALLAG